MYSLRVRNLIMTNNDDPATIGRPYIIYRSITNADQTPETPVPLKGNAFVVKEHAEDIVWRVVEFHITGTISNSLRLLMNVRRQLVHLLSRYRALYMCVNARGCMWLSKTTHCAQNCEWPYKIWNPTRKTEYSSFKCPRIRKDHLETLYVPLNDRWRGRCARHTSEGVRFLASSDVRV